MLQQSLPRWHFPQGEALNEVAQASCLSRLTGFQPVWFALRGIYSAFPQAPRTNPTS